MWCELHKWTKCISITLFQSTDRSESSALVTITCSHTDGRGCKGPTCSSGAIWGAVTCSRILPPAAGWAGEPNHATFQLPDSSWQLTAASHISVIKLTWWDWKQLFQPKDNDDLKNTFLTGKTHVNVPSSQDSLVNNSEYFVTWFVELTLRDGENRLDDT